MMKSVVFGLCFSNILLNISISKNFAEEKFKLSGYDNAHYMDPSGLPTLSDLDDATEPTENPKDAIIQLRELSLFFDFHIAEGILASLEEEN